MIDVAGFSVITDMHEKNNWFRQMCEKSTVDTLAVADLWSLLEISFELFKLNFESNNYEEFRFISNRCETLLDTYVEKKTWDTIVSNDTEIDIVIDIVCFVYELTQKYDQKATLLKRIIKTDGVPTKFKIRAAENALGMKYETDLFSEDELEQYAKMLGDNS